MHAKPERGVDAAYGGANSEHSSMDDLAVAAGISVAGASGCSVVSNSNSSSRSFALDTIERLKSQISATLSDEEELELNPELFSKDKALCSTAELELIRRERNRMHAKKTRLRKKKMLAEMETVST